MNINGSRFHLLLGAADWGRCLVRSDAGWRRLGDVATAVEQSPPALTTVEPAPLTVDARRQELRLQGEVIKLGATPGEAPFTVAARRSAAADRYGNVYWIDGDPRRLRVWSVGSDREAPFWPDAPVDCAAAHRPLHSDFDPVAGAGPDDRSYSALTVTDDHYLVAAFSGAVGRGLSAFDLMAGGPPRDTVWPSTVELTPFDMARRCGGGLWILDRVHVRLWELDRRLAVVSRAQPSTTLAPADVDVFQPSQGAVRERPLVAFPGGIDLRVVADIIDPIAVDVLPDGAVLILDRDEAAQRSRVWRLRRIDDAIEVDAPVWLPELAHDFVVSTAPALGHAQPVLQLFVATASGNQALAFLPGASTEPFALRGAIELFPLRRFGGRALLDIRGGAAYDSGSASLRWVPVVQQPRARYRDSAELITPVFDAAELQSMWDRVMLDACIPADAWVEVAARASDERAHGGDGSVGADHAWEVIGAWQDQPIPYLRSGGSELPWLGAQAARRTRRESGTGTWELLLQNLRGRYLQLRLRLNGNGTATPWIRALRVWAPRFSYPQRFLPGVYREDPVAGDFLERLLANPEGINSEIEGRIAHIEALFDPRCAPTETLPWLAEWFDLALDPTWEDWRRRLLITHAMDFFRWRGTTHGLWLAMTLAFAACVDDAAFAEPRANDTDAHGIRIVEAYLTRRIGPLAAGDPEAAPSGLIAVPSTALWTPQEGNAGLVERYAQAQGRPPTPAELVSPFALVAPEDVGEQARWRDFAERNLGFVPTAGADERALWRRFLQGRYTSLAELASAHGIADAAITAVELPADWPTSQPVADDWRAFCALPNDVRSRWQDFLGRRYRRVERLNAAHQTAWPAFDLVALPDRLPAAAAAQIDWLQFERQLLAIVRTAHRFSVLLPVTSVTEDPFEMDRQLQLARRIIELEKPAHTVFDVRFYWALNRIGEARLGIDTLIDVGSRAPQLLPDAVLGRAYVGASFVGGQAPPTDGDRHLLAC